MNEYGYSESLFTIKATDVDKTQKQLQTEEDLQTENKKWNLGDNVLVRYQKKKKKYKISYYKNIFKKGDLIFKKPKRSDVDCVPDDIILSK